MHSDEIASPSGFRGALVPGVAVYGHLVKPFVDQFGAPWLSDSSLEVKLIKPTYHGDQLSIAWTDSDRGVAASPRTENWWRSSPAMRSQNCLMI